MAMFMQSSKATKRGVLPVHGTLGATCVYAKRGKEKTFKKLSPQCGLQIEQYRSNTTMLCCIPHVHYRNHLYVVHIDLHVFPGEKAGESTTASCCCCWAAGEEGNFFLLSCHHSTFYSGFLFKVLFFLNAPSYHLLCYACIRRRVQHKNLPPFRKQKSPLARFCSYRVVNEK